MRYETAGIFVWQSQKRAARERLIASRPVKCCLKSEHFCSPRAVSLTAVPVSLHCSLDDPRVPGLYIRKEVIEELEFKWRHYVAVWRVHNPPPEIL